MTPDPITVEPSSTLRHCLRQMLVHGIRHLPIVDKQGRLVALVYDFQILRHCRLNGDLPTLFAEHADRTALSVAVAAGRTARPEQPLYDVLGLLSNAWEDAVIVLDPGKHPIGIFTVQDALALASDWVTPWWRVHQALTESREAIPGTMQVARALQILWGGQQGHSLVAEGSNLAGVIGLRELLSINPRKQLRVSEILKRPVRVVSADATIVAAATAMRERKLSAVAVIEDAQPRGMLTASDVLRVMRRALRVATTKAS